MMKAKVLAGVVFCVFCLTRAVCAQNRYFLSQVANGGSFRTTFILFNNNDTAVTAALRLTDDGAGPLSLTIPGLGTGSQFTLTLDPGATRFLQTDGSGSLVTGAATVTATGKIGISAIFSIYGANGELLTESGVGSSEPLSEFVVPVDATGLFNTGLALLNTGNGTASITLILLNTSGQEAGRTSLTLSNGAHVARFVAGAGQFFPSVGNFRGTLHVQSSVPLAALTLRQNASPLSYTSLPVVPKSSTRLALNLAQVANGSFSDGSFRTSFVVFNVSSSTANVVLSLTKSDATPFPVTIPGQGTHSTFSFTLPPGAALFLETDGSGALAAGAARITSNVPIGAAAIFSVFDTQGRFQTEAGVGDSPVLTELTFPVDITGNFDTGVAFFNPGNAAVTLTLRLLDSSGVRAGTEVPITLQGGNHIARFVSQLFAGTGNFVGSVAISAPGGVAALTVRQNSAPLSYTTLTVGSGISQGRAAPSALLTRTRTGVSAASDVTLDETLPSGVRLSGTISGPGEALLVFARASSGEVFAGAVNPDTKQYVVAVAQGTYTLTACFSPGGISSGAVTVSLSDPNPVQVTADTIRNITLPTVSLFNVSGTISGLSALPSSADATVVFTSANGASEGDFTLGSAGTYQGQLPAGTYTASLSVPQIELSAGQSEALSLFNLGSLTVSNAAVTASFNVPETAKLSGNIQVAGVSPLQIQPSVTASDTSGPGIADVTCVVPPTSSSVTVNASSYQLILSRNRSYEVDLTLPLRQDSDVVGILFFPATPAAVNLNGDMTFDFNVPALPGQVTISGRVTDTSGRGVGDVVVGALTQSLSGVPNAGFATGATTDANGNYRFKVLSGTDYQMLFIPLEPRP